MQIVSDEKAFFSLLSCTACDNKSFFLLTGILIST